MVEIYDDNDDGAHTLIGSYEEAMNKLLTNSKKYLKGELKRPEALAGKSNKKSIVIVYAEAVGESNVEVEMKASCMLVSRKRTRLQYFANCCR